MPPARKHFCKARPASSVPIAPNVSTCAPSAAIFAATFPAPPRHSLCETKSTTGTAASGESRVAVPHKYLSSIKSPSTPMRFPRNLGISFFKRGKCSAILVGIRAVFRLPYLVTSSLLFLNLSLFRQQHRDTIRHRVNPPARLALQPRSIRRKFHRRLADRTSQNLQRPFRNLHPTLHFPLQLVISNRTVTLSKRLQHEQPPSLWATL